MTATADLIASLVQQQYDELPAKRKPVVRDNGLHEWVPLSGIVAQGKDNKFRCISLATGMKCLPSAKLPQARGNVLHDWHAEVLAIRAFNRFVLDECKALAQGTIAESEFLRFRTAEEIATTTATGDSSADADNWHGQPFAWREDVRLHMYCSEAPCGDASMELTMSSQEDATPWSVPSPSPSPSPSLPPAAPPIPHLPGRAYFSRLGIVRRKPSRGDAPATLSKSCSDKLALAQCASLLSSAAAVLVSPSHAYLATLVLPASQHVAGGCRRAFSARGRMGRLVEEREKKKEEEEEVGEEEEGQSPDNAAVVVCCWPGGYAFRPFAVTTTGREFRFSRRSVAVRASNNNSGGGGGNITSSNLAVAWTSPGSATAIATSGQLESTLSGVLQGRRQADPRGASFASRRRLWGLAAEVADLLLRSSSSSSSSSSSMCVTHIQQIRASLGLRLPLPTDDKTETETETETKEGRGGSTDDGGVKVVEEEEEEVQAAAAAAAGGGGGRGTQAARNPPHTTIMTPATTTTTITYGQVKDSAPLRPRRRVKDEVRRDALRGWVRNTGDEDFTL
ncbi:adenosine deaminase/editase [Biscogniauxia mediterranea]|nr:adenosine deaminase/editase [Biscogniauxia mediterranea]